MHLVRRTQVHPQASLSRGFAQSSIDALIDIKFGGELCRRIPVRLDLRPVIHLRITVLPQRWPACWGDVRWLRVNADVVQYLPDLRALGNEGDEPHLPTAQRTRQRENLVDAGDQNRPQVVRRCALGWHGLWQLCSAAERIASRHHPRRTLARTGLRRLSRHRLSRCRHCVHRSNLGIQVFGGHGYIGEHGMEQIARDARISTLYEGTTGIQALDLLGRKVLLNTKGKCVSDFSGTILRMVKPYALQRTPMGQMMRTLARRTAQWNVLTTLIMLRASKDREQVGSSSVDYLMYSGFVMMAYFWALQAAKATELLAKSEGEGKGKESNDFYTAKIQTAEFYFARLLPRADGHYSAALAPTSAVMQMPQELFQMA